MARPKASQNKAKDVETKSRIEKLWAEYGKLAADEKRAILINQQRVQQMGQIMLEIQKLQ